MKIIPAIYLQNGQCVSWYKGHENEQKKVYRVSPIELAIKFQQQGATEVQIVDFDGSDGEKLINEEIAFSIVKKTSLRVQIGGGIRTEGLVEHLIHEGIEKVILGYSARIIIPIVVKSFGNDKIVAGIKAKKNRVDTDDANAPFCEVLDYAEELMTFGVTGIIYKDVESEGTFYPHYDEVERLLILTKTGHNISTPRFTDTTRAVRDNQLILNKHNHTVQKRSPRIFLSGGISEYAQLDILQKIGLDGVIISRALIEGKLDLRKCIENYSIKK